MDGESGSLIIRKWQTTDLRQLLCKLHFLQYYFLLLQHIGWLRLSLISSPVHYTALILTLLSIPQKIHWPSPSLRLTYTLTLLFLQYFLPISVLIFTYSRIAIEIWWKKSCPVLESCGSVKSVREERLERAKRRVSSHFYFNLMIICHKLLYI